MIEFIEHTEIFNFFVLDQKGFRKSFALDFRHRVIVSLLYGDNYDQDNLDMVKRVINFWVETADWKGLDPEIECNSLEEDIMNYRKERKQGLVSDYFLRRKELKVMIIKSCVSLFELYDFLFGGYNEISESY